MRAVSLAFWASGSARNPHVLYVRSGFCSLKNNGRAASQAGDA
ncbi:L-asparaginase [Aeromonas cavernicola]|uniref:L-asparaginase n=1 Tax=Aeromonas cavernicola TaxID=1006623 RepID=A0A2H9U9J9_9GAMM|nr:L-asparaginase [Aeromonas cavernicola]